MTYERLRELLSACPELTLEEIKRLDKFTPTRTAISVAVELAYSGFAWRVR